MAQWSTATLSHHQHTVNNKFKFKGGKKHYRQNKKKLRGKEQKKHRNDLEVLVENKENQGICIQREVMTNGKQVCGGKRAAGKPTALNKGVEVITEDHRTNKNVHEKNTFKIRQKMY